MKTYNTIIGPIRVYRVCITNGGKTNIIELDVEYEGRQAILENKIEIIDSLDLAIEKTLEKHLDNLYQWPDISEADQMEIANLAIQKVQNDRYYTTVVHADYTNIPQKVEVAYKGKNYEAIIQIDRIIRSWGDNMEHGWPRSASVSVKYIREIALQPK